ncbi:MAG: hypothetical protein EVA89_27635 [Sandaracinaceae bacterium]|nr:MAG: hypothetical protein EVA89_27635 [Sandaracinaceae bacterium]
MSPRYAMLVLCLVGCGAPPDLPDAGDAGEEDACVALTCAPDECGTREDGCGGAVDCGGCASGGRCVANRCEAECSADHECAPAEACDLSAGRCTSECRRGARVVLDVPALEVEIVLRLDGAPLPETSATDARLQLIREGGDFALEGHVALYEDGARITSPRAIVSPGRYHAILVEGARHLELGTVEVGPDAERLEVTATTVEPPLEVRFEGASAAWLGGALRFVSPALHERAGVLVPLGDLVDGRGTLQIVPGVYDVYYEPSGTRDERVAARAARLFEGLAVDGSPLSLELPLARLRGTVSLGGAAFPSGEGLTLQVASPGAWPVPVMHTDGEIDLVVPRGPVTLGVTPAAACTVTLDAGPASAIDIPCVRSEVRIALRRWPGPDACPLAFTTDEATTWVGHHELEDRVGGTSRWTLWGSPTTHVLRVASHECPRDVAVLGYGASIGVVDLASPGPHDVESELVPVALRATSGGAPLEGAVGWWGFEHPFAEGYYTTARTDAEVWLVGSEPYALHYEPTWPEEAGDWPATHRRLRDAIEPGASDVELERTEVEVVTTLAGEPFAAEAGLFGPRIVLRAVEGPYGGTRLSLGATRFHALPGRYSVAFERGGATSTPLDTLPPSGIDLGCWEIP